MSAPRYAACGAFTGSGCSLIVPRAEPRKEFEMRVRDIMTESLAFCPPDKTLDEIARMMVACDCGAVPVVDPETQKAVGIVTDRDIVCRAVAIGRDPAQVTAEDVMTMPITAVSPGDSIE